MDPWINAARPNRSFQRQTPPTHHLAAGGAEPSVTSRSLVMMSECVGWKVKPSTSMARWAVLPLLIPKLISVARKDSSWWRKRRRQRESGGVSGNKEVHTHIYSTKIKLLTRFINASSPVEKGLKLELSFTLMSTKEICFRHQIRAKRIKTHTDCDHYWGRHPPVEKHCFVWS